MISFNNAKREARPAKKTSLLLWIRLHCGVLFFGIMFIIGVLLGAAAASWLEISELGGVSEAISQFVSKRESQPAVNTFFSALTPNIAAWAAVFISGFCAISAPITAVVPCIRGMGYGVLACALLQCYPETALGYICMLLLPNLVISTITLLFCCCDAFMMSLYFWQSMTAKARFESIPASVFCGKMLLYGIFIAAGAAIEAYSYTLFV